MCCYKALPGTTAVMQEKMYMKKKKNGVTTEANMEGAVYELTFKWNFETMNTFRTVS